MQGIILRKQAVVEGLSRYYTGKPCKHGHVAERRTSDRQCLACCREKDTARYHADPVKTRAVARAQYVRHRAKRLAGAKLYLAKNGELVRARKRAAYAANPEKFREALKRAYAKDPARYKAYARNRKALKRAAPGSHTGEDIQRILKAQENACVYCDADLRGGYHVDHVIPLSRGGGNGPDNLQCLCAQCNLSKHDALPAEFEQRISA